MFEKTIHDLKKKQLTFLDMSPIQTHNTILGVLININIMIIITSIPAFF